MALFIYESRVEYNIMHSNTLYTVHFYIYNIYAI